MSRVLITGAAGFIGSHLSDALLDAGHAVYGVDNFTTGRRDNFPSDQGVLCEADVADAKAVGDLLHHFEPDVVVHAAASYKNPLDWTSDIQTNVQGTANVVRFCEENSVGRLIYFQTALCYGTRPASPVRVGAPLEPSSSYAITKTAGERFVENSDLNWLSFRLANIYGPRNLSGPIPTFYKRLTAGQTCVVTDTRRDFVYVDDAVRLFVDAVEGRGTSGHYHVSTGGDYAIDTICDTVAAALGIDAEPERIERGDDDTETICLDPSATKSEFGWKASTDILFGIRSAVAWYEQNPPQATYTHLKLAA